MSQPYRGIFVIVITPFTEEYQIDETSLRRQVDYCVEAGAHGLVGPANASEFSTLSDDERREWIRIVVDQAAGRIPVIATTTSGHRIPAVALSRYAQDIGADGIMSMPPHILHPDANGCYEYYASLSDALTIPIFIQNYIGPIGTPMSNEFVVRLCRELPNVEYIKEETLPEPRQISRTLAAADESCKGVFGGQGGVYMIDEWRRGACGNMPAAQITDLHVDIWNKLEANDEAGARKLYNQALLLINFERMHGVATYKEVMRRRGIFATTVSRGPGMFLDEMDLKEMDAIWEQVSPLLRVSSV